MAIRRYLTVFLHWWWLLVLGALLAGTAAFLTTQTLPQVYRATTLLFVNQTAVPGAITYSDALLSQQLVKTYSQMATQPIVLEAVQERLRLPFGTRELARIVSARPIRETQLIEIAVEGNQPEQVRDIANTVAEVFIEQQRQLVPSNQANNSLNVAQPALTPAAPIGPRLWLNTLLSALLGLLAMIALVALIEYLDDTVKNPEDLERIGGLATLGAVMRREGEANGPGQLVANGYQRSAGLEAYRLVRTNLEFAGIDSPVRTLLVTSAWPGEGKSTTVANLGIVLAQVGKRVLLVDTDLRRPSLHRVFKLSNQQGLTNLLVRDAPRLDEFLQRGPVDGLQLLPTGPLPPNPAELLASPRFDAVIELLRQHADIIVFDSPPVQAVTDAIVLAAKVDGTVLVVDSQRTRAEAVRRSIEALGKSGTRLLGAVLNKLSQRSGAYYYQYYNYNYGDGAADTSGAQNGGLPTLKETGSAR